MERLVGILGILCALGLAFLMSDQKKEIKLRIVFVGLAMQAGLAFLILKTESGIYFFERLGRLIVHYIEAPAKVGAEFVFGFLVRQDILAQSVGAAHSFVFFFNILATLIFIAVLVNIGYYFGIIQKIVSLAARGMNYLLPISGSESVSNIASAFVGQVEAQIMIKPYLKNMTKSELFTSMVGSFSCISGSIMVVYISLGINPTYIIAASIMAIPGSLLLSKIVMPETEISATRGNAKIHIEHDNTNIIAAVTNGCSEGLKIALNMAAVLIGVIALIKLVNLGLGGLGGLIHYPTLDLTTIFSWLLRPLIYLMGVPPQDVAAVSGILGMKLTVNEFVAFMDLQKIINTLQPKTIMMMTIALCSFANFSSLGMQIAGIGELAPTRKADIMKIGLKALLCGSLTSYLSASIVGVLF